MLKRLIAAVLCICLLIPAAPVWAVQPESVQTAATEEELRQAVLGDPQWLNQYPHGLFNFVGGEFSVREDQEFYEFAIARQGGTSGRASVDLKLIDVSAEYGVDYTIRVYGSDRVSYTEISPSGDSAPLMDALPEDAEVDLSMPEDEETAGSGQAGEETGSGQAGEETGSGQAGEGADQAGQEAGQTGEEKESPASDSETDGDTDAKAETTPEAVEIDDDQVPGAALPGTQSALKAGSASTSGSGLASDGEMASSPALKGGPEPIPASGPEDATTGPAVQAPESTTTGPNVQAPESTTTGPAVQAPENATTEPAVQAPEKSGSQPRMGLRQAREIYTGIQSDRQSWRQVDAEAASELEAAYDEVYDGIPGAVGRIVFEEGEYIKYLRIIPVNHKEFSGDRQSMMVLTDPSVGAFRGEAYTATLQILDDREREPGRIAIEQSSVTVRDGQARVTLTRTGNTVDIESILVGTREDSAVSGADYTAGTKEITFLPGVERQTVTVDILPNEYRTEPRVFYIALDRDNVRADKERAECAVTIPADPDAAGAEEISARRSAATAPADNGEALETAAVDSAASFKYTGAERISKYGSCEWHGVWLMQPQDFFWDGDAANCWIQSFPTVPNFYRLRFTYKGGKGWAYNKSTKLYGVDHIENFFANDGYGKDYWSWFKTHHEHRYHAGITVNGQGVLYYNAKLDFANRISGKLPESLWNTSKIGFWSDAYSGNQVDIHANSVALHLKPYTASVMAAERLTMNDYTLNDKGTLVRKSSRTYNPGTISISQVVSNVYNSHYPNASSTKVFRSDLLRFSVQYSAENPGGKYAEYTGFRIKAGTGWITFSGYQDMLLDAAFFQKTGMLDAIRSGTIQIQPIFTPRTAKAVFETNQSTGYFANFGSGSRGKTLAGLQVGDTIENIIGRGNAAVSLTPRFSARSSSNELGSGLKNAPVEITDPVAGTTAKLTLGDVYTKLTLTFANPTLTVTAHPAFYAVRPGAVNYKVDGVSMATHEAFMSRMETALQNGENPEIVMSFTCEDDVEIRQSQQEYLTQLIEARLTVYESDGSVIKQKSQRVLPFQNGGFTLSGKLKDLGWERGDFATVIVYGKTNLGGAGSTQETAVDFMMSSRDGVMVTGPNNSQYNGHTGKTVLIPNANPTFPYRMDAFAADGFIANWVELSTDTNGNGIEEPDEERAGLQLLKKLGYGGDDLRRAHDTTLFYGNTFAVKPSFFPNTKIYYKIDKKPSGGVNPAPVYVTLTQKCGTVLDPEYTGKSLPVKNAAVIVGNTELNNVRDNLYAGSDPTFVWGQSYLGQVALKSYTYYFRAQPGISTNVEIDTSDVMMPEKFTTTVKGTKIDFTKVTNGAKTRTVDIESGDTVFTYRFNNSNTGITPNNSIIRIYDDKDALEATYQTGKPKDDGTFTFTVNTLADNHIKPGYTMSIAAAYDATTGSGIQSVEFPEVPVGFAFAQKLTALNIAASFDTPVSPALKLFGDISAKYDLGVDMDMKDDDQFDISGFTDDTGRDRVLKTMTFGFNKKNVKDLLAKIEKVGKSAPKESAASPKPTGKPKVQEMVEEGGGGQESSPEQVKESVKNVADDGQVVDKKTQKPRGSGQGAVAFDFNVALTVVLEEGRREQTDGTGKYTGNGFHYFSAFTMVATATASADYTYTYVTPIGIPVMASLKASGSAVFTYGVEADAENPYSVVYQFDGDGKISFNADNYLQYVKFYVDPQLTIGAGVGFSLLNVMIYGKAAFDLEFYQPVASATAKSSGSGGVTFSASVAVKVLFISKQWELYKSDRIEMFSYGKNLFGGSYFDQSYRLLGQTEDDGIMDRDYLNGKSEWMPDVDQSVIDGGEQVLIESAYPYPQTKLIDLKDGRRFLLFIDDDSNRDDRNRAVLKYTVYDGGQWSEPQAIEGNDGTWDESPDAFVIGDQILVVWSDASKSYGKTDGEISALTQMDLTGCWFDTASLTPGAPFELTKSNTGDLTADMYPQISVSDDYAEVIVFYTKIDYNDPWAGAGTDKSTGPDTDLSDQESLPAEDEALYGDVVNGYNTICYRRAHRQANGTYKWETAEDYDSSEFEGQDPDFINAFQKQYYGQRFLKLTVPADIEENTVVETTKIPVVTTEAALDAEGNPIFDQDGNLVPQEVTRYIEKVTGRRIEQTATFNNQNPEDARVVESASAQYGGKAVFAYTVDMDSNLKSMTDQRMYLMLYDFATGEFSTPILLCQDTEAPGEDYDSSGETEKAPAHNASPRFGELDGALWLFWLRDGDIVSTNVSALLGKNENDEEGLIELEVQGAPIDGGTESVLAPNKANGQDCIEVAVAHQGDRVISDFAVAADGSGAYLVWVDDCVSFLDEETGNEDPENVVHERQLFAAYREGEKEEGPVSFTQTSEFDFAASTAESWSRPVQLTFDQGANFSDLSFVMGTDGALELSYVRYEQENQNDMSVPQETGRRLAVREISVESTLEAGELEMEEDRLILAGETVPASLTVKNTGVKPLANLEYRGFVRRNGQTATEGVWKPVSEVSSVLMGGDDRTVTEVFTVDEPQGAEIGIEVRAAGAEPVSAVRQLKAEMKVAICVNHAELLGPDQAYLSLTLANDGNVAFTGPVTVNGTALVVPELKQTELEPGQLLQRTTETEFSLAPGEQKDWSGTVAVNLANFGPCHIDEDGSMMDALSIVVKAGESQCESAIIRRLDKEATDAVSGLKSFLVKQDGKTLGSGEKLQLREDQIVSLTHEIVTDGGAARTAAVTDGGLCVIYRSANTDVAVADTDGRLIPMGQGVTAVTATLYPGALIKAKEDSYEVDESTWRYPADAVIEKQFAVQVGESQSGGGHGGGGGESEKTENPALPEPGQTQKPGDKTSFADVKETDWFYTAVAELTQRGVLAGVGNGRFAPEEKVKRADFLIMVMKAFGLADEQGTGLESGAEGAGAGQKAGGRAEENFADAGNAYYTDWLAKAKGLGIVSGVGGNRFAPEEEISRQDMLVMLYNALRMLDQLPEAVQEAVDFTDEDQVAAYARAVVREFSAAGIVSGYENRVAPERASQRSEAAQIIFNLLKRQEKVD